MIKHSGMLVDRVVSLLSSESINNVLYWFWYPVFIYCGRNSDSIMHYKCHFIGLLVAIWWPWVNFSPKRLWMITYFVRESLLEPYAHTFRKITSIMVKKENLPVCSLDIWDFKMWGFFLYTFFYCYAVNFKRN